MGGENMLLRFTKKFFSFLTITSLIMVSSLCTAAAESQYQLSENRSATIIPCPDLGVYYERIVEDNSTTVLIKGEDGVLQDTLLLKDGNVYLNGSFLFSNTNNTVSSVASDFFASNSIELKSVSWGQWLDCAPITIKTGGLSTAVICGLISLNVGWCPLGVATAVASIVAGKYDTLKVTAKIRYGTEGSYIRYERKTWFYGDGKLIYGPFTDTGKRPNK